LNIFQFPAITGRRKCISSICAASPHPGFLTPSF